MPPKTVESSSAKRGTVEPAPKEQGCFQCSRRRIICDRGEPSCNKCIKKGIECSGRKRIRFTDSVARRGRLKDCKVPDIRSNGEAFLPIRSAFTEVRWQNDRKKVKKRTREPPKHDATTEVSEPLPPPQLQESTQTAPKYSLVVLKNLYQQQSEQDHSDGASTSTSSDSPLSVINEPAFPLPKAAEWHVQNLDDDVEEITRVEDDLVHLPIHQAIQPWIAPLRADIRKFFSYYSEAVAPVMVVLDTDSNGYRQFVLPMAMENDVLRQAVGVVAAQLFSQERPEMRNAAEAGRAAIISRLRNEALTAPPDQVFNKFTWATLIVLLVGETVTGSGDYAFLIQMLLTLSANSRVENEDSALTRFLVTQTNMFEMLGMPLRGEHTGVMAIKRSHQSWQDWLTSEEYPANSENHRNIDKIRMCFDIAHTVYIRRATPDGSSPAHKNTLQAAAITELIDRLYDIPPEAPGAHALVWPLFIAGAEASDPMQRAFFADYMMSIYRLTKFRNIPIAVQSLENIWATKGDKRWTECLPEHATTLIM